MVGMFVPKDCTAFHIYGICLKCMERPDKHERVEQALGYDSTAGTS